VYTVKEKGGKPYRNRHLLPYGLRNPYRSLKTENSQNAQKPQWNCTFMNSEPALLTVLIRLWILAFSSASSSVADPGCLSRIPDPDFYLSRIPDLGSWIPDPKTATKERGEEKFVIKLFFVVTNFTKLNIILFLKCWRKIWANFQRIIEVFTQTIFTKLSKIWVWDPGSGKNLFRILDPGSRGQKGTGSRIRIRNTGFFASACLHYVTPPLSRPYRVILICGLQVYKVVNTKIEFCILSQCTWIT
jgi:hypothetical protein